TEVAVPPVMFSVIGLFVLLYSTVALLAPATGACGLTVIVTVAGAEVPPAFVAVYWNVSLPE
ncbi:unnamed protein product, partial [marine sediment metagenome]